MRQSDRDIPVSHCAIAGASGTSRAPELAAIEGIQSHTIGKEGYANTITIEPMDAERVAALLGLAPKYGEWELRISVDGRPPGPLPGLSWGPSPAYPLAGSGVKVTSITIDRRQ